MRHHARQQHGFASFLRGLNNAGGINFHRPADGGGNRARRLPLRQCQQLLNQASAFLFGDRGCGGQPFKLRLAEFGFGLH